ncbi:hypothetical protein [Paraburkholderia sp. BL6669N2]|uniref:hypothetical protein n=1 Tax=Paraburkholderia sp. BL6669N2 TaxID=1938807 RepID=UPI000E289863|nr:hypothetical protein [Paraburkholderia sp. BL6669N2]
MIGQQQQVVDRIARDPAVASPRRLSASTRRDDDQSGHALDQSEGQGRASGIDEVIRRLTGDTADLAGVRLFCIRCRI